jgi:hypothetical protein
MTPQEREQWCNTFGMPSATEQAITARFNIMAQETDRWRGMELTLYKPSAFPDPRPVHCPVPIPAYRPCLVDVFDTPAKRKEREAAEAFIAKRKQEGRKPIGKRSFMAVLERRARQ